MTDLEEFFDEIERSGKKIIFRMGAGEMNPSKMNGYWTKKDMSCYVFIEKVFNKGKKAGKATGFRYFIRTDGKEVIDLNSFIIDQEELKKDYWKGMKTNDDK